jgi:NADH-quinone oxidoreductase subunit K
MSAVPLSHALLVAVILFVVGFTGVVIRRNSLFILMSLEIMLNALGIAFVAAGSIHGQADGQVMFILILTLAAAEASVGLALLIRIKHRHQSLDIDQLNSLRSGE